MTKKNKPTITLYSWNVNGIRAVSRQHLGPWIASVLKQNKNIGLSFQEVKAHFEQVPTAPFDGHNLRYHWHAAKKPGYSGVATFGTLDTLNAREGLGFDHFDSEGRVLTTEYSDFYWVNAYFPNSQRDHARLDYKLEFCDLILKHCKKLRATGKMVVLSGDFNIAHHPIDLKNPKANEDNAGYLPEERAWMSSFLSAGFTDVFRARNPDAKDHYTWWSYRPGIRERNVGWRLDYFCVDTASLDRVLNVKIWPKVLGSDHCPISIDIV